MANKKRLIDANALIDVVDESKLNNPHPPGMVRVNHRNEHDHFLRMILDAPTVDALEVVRCKDCEYFTKGMAVGMCKRIADKPIMPITYNHFCSYGERRKTK